MSELWFEQILLDATTSKLYDMLDSWEYGAREGLHERTRARARERIAAIERELDRRDAQIDNAISVAQVTVLSNRR